ncbi:WecB/TagA/CpsF family glycosyltransferase [Stutzerimonas nitrititolerans]|uniref:WecB/TagA/CpsF family glycosyltransferase n=1 Tax=Stutzerimonas nitrititolerans TaxID=2482751 RepID=UPI0035E41E20
MVVLAVGYPRQELIGRLIQADGRARGVGHCVGASIDFSPARSGERRDGWTAWLRRMCTEPRRLAKRYAKDAV